LIDLRHGDCLEVLRTLPDNSVDAVVTDPPYGLSFMGKRWDYDVPSVEIWAECLRVLKPGGHLLVFAGTRTQHRMAVRIEDAGFEIRDMIAWVYGSGFPKSLDVSKAIDKAAGAEREVVGVKENSFGRKPGGGDGWGEAIEGGKASDHVFNITAPATDAARQWQGWGTALKPALEPITVARKPLAKGCTVAENVLDHGTGALNVDGCRVGTNPGYKYRADANGTTFHGQQGERTKQSAEKKGSEFIESTQGRWPANLIHDGSDEVLAGFPQTGPSKAAARGIQQRHDVASPDTARPKEGTNTVRIPFDAGTGSAARFFYCAKASKRDRDEGLEHMPAVHRPNGNKRTDQDYRVARGERPASAESGPRRNIHPTVKPTDLMRYLCRLVTPPGGVVLDPFMGSGSTGKAAILEGFKFIGIEREAEYVEIARARIDAAKPSKDLFSCS
jgi:site-specific DNA-methyltransferase (adenine-specific)